MQKLSPLAMVAVLGACAIYFQARSRPGAVPPTPPMAEAPAGEQPAAPSPPSAQAPEADPATPSALQGKPWPQKNSDIPADPKAVFGTLPNGFRYMIYPNAEPPGRVSLRLHIATGSLMEQDDQQGLAHFMEHMVFNGSKHYKADELVPVMQRLGIGFGAHVNAFTSFEETIYMLDLPELSKDVLDLGYGVLRDFADGALLDPAEIDKERGVILSEKTSRDSVAERLQEMELKELLPGSLIANRFPIGKEDVISHARRERFTAYYEHYYIPSRMTFVVVGDIDPKAMEKRIEEAFGSMTNPETPGAEPDLGPVTPPEGLATAVFTDKEVASTTIAMTAVRPYEIKPDTSAKRMKDMPLEIANAMLDRRFERLARKQNSPILGGKASREDMFNHVETGDITVTAAESRWKDAVPVLEQEYRRALDFGFTDSELAEAKANLINSYEQAVKTKATRQSEDIASEVAESIPEGTVFSTPEKDLEIGMKGLNALTPESCHTAFKEFWGNAGVHLILTTREAEADAKGDLAAIFQESRGKPVTAPVGAKVATFAYTRFGSPGKIVSEKKIDDLGITQLVLSNNVRVNLKKTDFEKNKISLMARIGSGQLSQPAEKPGLSALASALLAGGGLGKHSEDDLQQILAGRNVSAQVGIGEDAFLLSGATTPEDFPLEMHLACASLVDPGYREEALWQFRKGLPAIEQQLKHTTAGPQTELEAWLHGGDTRFVFPPVAKLGGYTVDDVKKWLTPDLEKGYLELSIVGDFDQAAVVPVLLSTVGALPKRAATKAPMESLRKVKLPAAPASKTYTFDSKIPSAVSLAYWPTEGVRGNTREVRRLNILASIYGDRLREEIREKLGASYSPDAAAEGSDALEKFGYLVGEATAKPEDVERLGTVMKDLADKLAQEGATDDELDRARKPVLSSLEKSNRDNSYWLATVLAQSQEDPNRLELARHRDADYRSVSLDDVNTLAKKYLGAGNAIGIAIKPEAK